MSSFTATRALDAIRATYTRECGCSESTRSMTYGPTCPALPHWAQRTSAVSAPSQNRHLEGDGARLAVAGRFISREVSHGRDGTSNARAPDAVISPSGDNLHRRRAATMLRGHERPVRAFAVVTAASIRSAAVAADFAPPPFAA